MIRFAGWLRLVKRQQQAEHKSKGIKMNNHSGMKMKTNVKAGGGGLLNGGNHNQSGLAVKSAVKAGGLILSNHNQTAR